MFLLTTVRPIFFRARCLAQNFSSTLAQGFKNNWQRSFLESRNSPKELVKKRSCVHMQLTSTGTMRKICCSERHRPTIKRDGWDSSRRNCRRRRRSQSVRRSEGGWWLCCRLLFVISTKLSFDYKTESIRALQQENKDNIALTLERQIVMKRATIVLKFDLLVN